MSFFMDTHDPDLRADEAWMARALELAGKAAERGEIPVGAVVVCGDQIVGEAGNRREGERDPLGHAELRAIEAAAQHLGRWRLSGCTLYVTLEPCVMCAGAIVQSRIDRVVYGTRDPKAGAVQSLYKILEDPRLNHRPLVGEGILADQCSRILRDFFRALRDRKPPRDSSRDLEET